MTTINKILLGFALTWSVVLAKPGWCGDDPKMISEIFGVWTKHQPEGGGLTIETTEFKITFTKLTNRDLSEIRVSAVTPFPPIAGDKKVYNAHPNGKSLLDNWSLQSIVAFVFGVAFIVTLMVLAIAFPAPTPFQYNVFRIVLSLAAAGVAAMIPGFIYLDVDSKVGLLIRAGGALAVFVMVFFFNPAHLAHHNES
jgi:hypothetical protein